MVPPAKLNGRGRHLAARRVAKGLSQASLAAAVGAPTEAVQAWESGTDAPLPEQHPQLAEVLGLELDDLLELIAYKQPQPVDSTELPPTYGHYGIILNQAERIDEVQQVFAPRMLQTRAYAIVVEHFGPAGLDDEDEIMKRVDERLAHQVVLYRRPLPVDLTVLLAESVLREEIGGPVVMRTQLDHLLEMSKLDNIEIRLLQPDGRGTAAQSGYEMMAKRYDYEPFMVVSYDPTGRNYHTGDFKVRPYVEMFDHLYQVAMGPADSIRRIAEFRDRYC